MKKSFTIALLALVSTFTFAQKINIIPSVGYAWRTAKLPDNINDDTKTYLKGLKSGMNYDIGAYYRLNNTINLGVKYNLYTASSTGNLYANNPQQNETVIYRVTTKDKISFVGPGFLYSNFNEAGKHKLYYDMALGVITYISNTDEIRMDMKGSNLGLASTIGYMYQFSPYIMAGPQISYTGGTLKKMKINGVEYNLNEGEYEALHRIALSAGVTFQF